jgi:hypothetical protein
MSHHEIHSAIWVIKAISGVWKPRLTTLASWHECHPYHGKMTRNHLMGTRIPDTRSLDPDPGCPFLGPGSTGCPFLGPGSTGCPFLGDGPTGTTCWSLARVASGQRDLPATGPAVHGRLKRSWNNNLLW